jgi:chlorite dismutase
MQLLAFGGCGDAAAVTRHLERSGLEGVVYEDANDPRGIAVLSLTRTPETFVERVRPALNTGPCEGLTLKPAYTMLGRSYSLGYEPDLKEALIDRPRRTVLNHDWRWAVWYPLRRSGRFAQLTEKEQRTILAEHGAIGMAFGAGDYAHDVRLACHGLDRDDNDFVIGLIGKDLFPLSALIQPCARQQTGST